MFTGLITHVGTFARVTPLEQDQGVRVRIESALSDGSLELGESIAVDGCCLTVVAHEPGWFDVELSPETLARTTFSERREGQPVNLERALRLGDRLGGHWVQGHVDGVGVLTRIQDLGDMHQVDIEVPENLQKYMVEKGSLTVSGISLTVNQVADSTASLTIIPHTWDHTTLGRLAAGARIHLEVDILAKYVESLLPANGRDTK